MPEEPNTPAPPYDVLFEPVRIGPLVTRNRFFQVPHCNGMGYRDPSAQAVMRKVKAQGGWSVVCTEQVEIHPTSDITPFLELRNWSDQDIPTLARIAEAVHEGGGLAGIELCHNGMNAPNQFSRETPLGPANLPVAPDTDAPVQARAMAKSDIADLRRWHRQAVQRSLRAGYDLVYVYAGHAYGGIQHFLSTRFNDRTDEYGGSLENRMRLLREILEDTIEEVDGRAAVACRITVDESIGDGGISRQDIEGILQALGEIPDLWDFVMGTWEADSVTSRFGPEGGQERYVAGLKQFTSKPVVGVGRFTSPDEMVRQVKTGVLDLIGAARPSIADPFLPEKIRTERMHTIRECIGCNICVSGDQIASPIRCTQNPTMGEEFRRGWHPEALRPNQSGKHVLIVGAGPAGLEAAVSLGRRGYEVSLLEATRELGGRVTAESRLPNLSAWSRVRDYREQMLGELPNVRVYRESPMSAEDIVEFGFRHVAIAAGATWRADGVARWHTHPIPIEPDAAVLTPNDLFAGHRPGGTRVVVYDDDHYYMGGVLAELLRHEGYETHIVTPAARVSSWTEKTLEIDRIQRRLIEAGVQRHPETALQRVRAGGVVVANSYTGAETDMPADCVVMVTARTPDDDLYHELRAMQGDSAPETVRAIGDCSAPSTIAAAVWSGRRFAEEFDSEPSTNDGVGFEREVTELASRKSAGLSG